MAQIELNKSYKFTRPTFLLKGVFVLQNSKVEPQEVNDDGTYKILYIDREGFQQIIEDAKAEELEPLE